MANNRKSIVTFAISGMNGSVHPAALDATTVSKAVNCQLKGQLLTTRPGFRAIQLGPDADAFRGENIQGAFHYNPVYGQSQQSFGKNTDSILITAGGKKFHFTFGVNGVASVSDETGKFPSTRDAQIVWIYQAENFLIVQDGSSSLWIWDGVSEPFTSTGYRTDEPSKSRLANAASAGTYAHGRIVQVVEGNKVLVGDIIHKTRLSDPQNILQMTEQIYFATGSHFSPPSNMGEVVAIGILPLSNTQHGHDDVVVHCRRGIFSLKIDHAPRSEWVEIATSKHLLLDTSATGPYALILYDGDQMFRSRNGLQTIRSAAANANILGNPNQPISEPVAEWLNSDHQSYLKFASMAKWATECRILCTTGLWSSGRFRGGRGMVSLNLNPDGSMSPETRAWEGLWTLPPGLGFPSQLLNAPFNGGDRLFVASTIKDSCSMTFRNNLLELDEGLKYDILEDGTISRISCQVILGQYPTEGIGNVKYFRDGRLNLVNVQGKLDWGVWARINQHDAWILWSNGKFDGATECDVADFLAMPKSYRLRLDLGDAPKAVSSGHTIQVLVRWRGYAAMESMMVGYEEDTSNSLPEKPGDKIIEMAPCEGYNDYEYTENFRWEE